MRRCAGWPFVRTPTSQLWLCSPGRTHARGKIDNRQTEKGNDQHADIGYRRLFELGQHCRQLGWNITPEPQLPFRSRLDAVVETEDMGLALLAKIEQIAEEIGFAAPLLFI